jgi:hypothetical protein
MKCCGFVHDPADAVSISINIYEVIGARVSSNRRKLFLLNF